MWSLLVHKCFVFFRRRRRKFCDFTPLNTLENVVFYTTKFGLFWAVPQYHRGRGRRGGRRRGSVHLAAGTRKSGQWSLVPSYGWGLDYPKPLSLFWEILIQTNHNRKFPINLEFKRNNWFIPTRIVLGLSNNQRKDQRKKLHI